MIGAYPPALLVTFRFSVEVIRMGREVRRVPANWQHPKTVRGEFVSLDGSVFSQCLAEWDEGAAKWADGLVADFHGGWEPKPERYAGVTYVEWDGERPVASEYMPEWSEAERTHWQMYETASEGTPISPVMATPEELARWLVDNGASAFADITASYEQWLGMIRRGSSVSMVVTGSGEVLSGVAALEREKEE